jgi:hypothetical protein
MRLHASSIVICVMAGMLHAASSRSTDFHSTATVTRTSVSHKYATARPSTGHEDSRAHAEMQPDFESASSVPHGPWTRSSSDSVLSATVTSTSTASLANTGSTTSDSSVFMLTDTPLKACWALKDCLNVIDDFASSWDVTGINLTESLNRGPDGLNEAGSAFAVYFCKVKHYEKSVCSHFFPAPH